MKYIEALSLLIYEQKFYEKYELYNVADPSFRDKY